MSEKPVPNIFILLDLDPDKSWNQAEFERQLQKKRQEWSRLVNVPTQKGIRAKQNLGLIPELQKIAADESLRQSLAEAARQEKAATRSKEIKEFEDRLELLQIKGCILEGELDLLITEFVSVLSEPEIRSRLKVPIRKEQPAARTHAEALESTKAKEIQRRLQSQDKTDLYDFLGAGWADNSVLLQEARKRYEEVQNKGVKTPNDTIVSELSGYCLDIFKSDAERAKYNETLRLQEYESLKAKVDVIGQVARKVDAKQMEQLLREAREKKLNPDEALSVIQQHAGKKGISIVLPEAMVGSIRELIRCGYCNHLNDKDNMHCSGCGQLLRDACPKCGQMVASEDTACGACGFPIGNRLYVVSLLNDAAQAHVRRDLNASMDLLGQARQCWPSTSADTLGKRIRELEAKVVPDKKAQDNLIRQLETAIARKRLYEARSLLPQLERLLPADNPLPGKYHAQIEPKIQQAETRLGQAQQASKIDPEKAIRLYQEVLSLCQDCQEAREMLAQTPPSPPLNLQAHVSGLLVHLTWRPSPSQGVRYVVVRKKQSRPISASDGERVAIVEGSLYDDTAAEVGVPAFYAIYADREETPSKDAAVLSQPVMLVQEVTRLTARVAERQVSLQWEAPPNAHKILLVRSETRYPTHAEDGVLIPTLGKNQAVDNQVENGRRYFYTIFCQFLDHAGKPLLTDGTRIEATPQQPPSPVKDISITDSGPLDARQVLIRWEPVTKGEVVVLKSSEPTGLEFGAIILQQDLSKYGQLLVAHANQANDQINQLGFYYYLPVVVFQGLAYIGQEKRYVCVEDVADLSVQNLGRALRLQWRWPPNCQETLVTYSYTGWPRPHTSEAITASLTRAQYDLHGYYDISNPVKVDHYIKVFAVINQGGQKITASGESKAARKLVCLTSRISVSYEIKKPWMRQGLSLHLSIEGEGTLPALILTAKQAVLPMNKSDGEIVLRVEAAPIQKHQLSFALPPTASRRQSYARLFLENDAFYGAVTIRHPDREKMRLF